MAEQRTSEEMREVQGEGMELSIYADPYWRVRLYQECFGPIMCFRIEVPGED